ncbi:carbohydrate esterase family 3 protein, partial [Amniculicola lignicola CBS 123094]
LRIMPLGASITQGAASVPLNGYRKGLRDQLRFLGYEVNMVGSGSDGAFNDNQHEGHPGALIRELLDPRPEKYLDELQVGMKYKPNVVLILVGSNDCVQGHIANDKTFQNARILEMETLINWVYDNSAGVTVILATLPPTGPSSQFPDLNSYVFLLNNEYRKLVLRYKSNGKRIELADMNTGFFQQPADGTPGDVLHPNNQGYAKLAAVFAKAMQSVESSIQTPTNTGIPDKGTGVCPPNANSFSGPVQTQRGSGVEDGSYRHAETAMGTLVKNTLTLPTFGTHDKQFMFAQLVSNVNIGRGGEADDMILALDFEQQSYLRGLGFGILNYKLNGHWDEDWIALTTNAYCNPIWLRWGDFNNDGLDDWICLEDNGDMTVQINLGGSPPKFSGPNVVRNNKGTAQSAIRLGDIDGDGRLDYCYIAANQDIYCFRNGGQGNGVDYWQEMGGGGPTFNGKAWPETNGIRLVDINGDFRADVVYVFGDGATAIWINQRGTAADGPGLKPAWIAAASSHGPTGLGRDQVKFARIYASGRADYIKAVTKETEVRPLPSVSVYESTWSVVRNDGCCGKNLRGDGVHYCDMYGRGHDDYIWIWSDGKITVYENINNPPFWDPHEFVLDVATPRKHVHFADWNGDGKCDVLTVDQISGQVSVWLNTYNGVGNVPTFAGKAVAVAAPACSQRDGVGLFDQAARFADVDGDGRADFLCLELSGRTTGWLSKPTGAQSIGQVKLGVGLDRANLQYVDLNGDRRADLVWYHIQLTSSSVQIFNNQGMIPSSGSAFQWGPPTAGLWKKGMDRGANLYFAKMSNSGKVDYVQNLPKTNIAYVWYNQCPGGGSLDDGPIVDPHLPVVP